MKYLRTSVFVSDPSPFLSAPWKTARAKLTACSRLVPLMARREVVLIFTRAGRGEARREGWMKLWTRVLSAEGAEVKIVYHRSDEKGGEEGRGEWWDG